MALSKVRTHNSNRDRMLDNLKKIMDRYQLPADEELFRAAAEVKWFVREATELLKAAHNTLDDSQRRRHKLEARIGGFLFCG